MQRKSLTFKQYFNKTVNKNDAINIFGFQPIWIVNVE